jgi:hypothetical protein
MTFVLTPLAIILLALTLQDAFEVMLLPRRIPRRVRFMRLFFRYSWIAWSRASVRLTRGGRREHALALFGPLAMLMLFAAWAASLILCFGVLMWASQAQPLGAPRSSLPEQVYMSGVTFFTLGYGDVTPHSGISRFLSVLEAGTGIGFIAVVIGYLPVLYQLFTRREAHVLQLDGRAGSPPDATTMLCRHAGGCGLASLNEMLREWEVWCSELLESHLSYPMLAYYRSQHDNQSWLAALGCVMDACALVLVGVPALAPLQARMTFSMARQVLVELARSFEIRPSRFEGIDRLSPETFATMLALFAESGLDWDAGPDAKTMLDTLRGTYEPLLDGLARHLLLTVPAFIGTDTTIDHWAGGHRGLMAQRLLDELSNQDRASNVEREADGDERLWRRIRARLRET